MKVKAILIVLTLTLLITPINVAHNIYPFASDDENSRNEVPYGQDADKYDTNERLSAPPSIYDLMDRDGNGIADGLDWRIKSLNASRKSAEEVEVIIQPDPGALQLLNKHLQKYGIRILRKFHIMPAIHAKMRLNSIESIARLPIVRRIDPNVEVQALLNTSLPVIGVPPLWMNYGLNGTGQTIAILDTGIWSDHPDFYFPDGRSKIIAWYDLVNFNPTPYDDNGHGTAVAGAAAGTGLGSMNASRGTSLLIRGPAYGANIVAVKVLDKYGTGTLASVILGIQWVVDHKDDYNITVINLSLGTRGPSDGKDALSKAANSAVDAGVIVVAAAGNFGPEPYTLGSPAAAEKVIAVGAVERSMSIVSWSSRGPTLDDRYKPDICAVGVSVIAPSLPYLKYPEIQWWIYRAVSGTSIAAPQIAGAIVLLKESHPDWTLEMLKAAMLTRAVPMEGGVNNAYGYGVVNASNALYGPAPALTVYTWSFIGNKPTFAEAVASAPRNPNPYVLINGKWFAPNSLIDIKWDNVTHLATSININENGSFAVNITIPRSNWGIHYISIWNSTGFITQYRYVILRPTLMFSASDLFQTTMDFARPGVTVWAKGYHYDPNGTITIKWDNATVLADDVPIDSEGMLKTDVTIPLNATTGLHYISIWNGTEFITQREFHVVEATPVSGIINENTTWTRYGSPYILTGDLLL
ncbi:hypothetical protein DRO69_12550, partial [Candidatus Bathyarchaeota archaeon]